LDLELVPKENRLDIRKCNGRIPRGLKPKEETFQVVLDALALTPCYPAFLIIADVPEVYMHQFWNCIYKHDDFYRFKIDKKKSELVPRDEEPVKKGKRLKTPAKKSASKPATGIIIIEPHVETKLKRKEKEKVDVAHEKGIDLLSEVALSEKDQMKEVKKKSLRDFHKTHPSGSGMIVEDPPSVEKITPTVTSEGTGDKPGDPDVTKDDSTESESESCGNDEDDSNNEQESSNDESEHKNESEEQESNSEQDEESDDDDQEEEEFDQENESEDDKMKSDEEQGMDDTTDLFDDDVDARLEEPTETATGIVQVVEDAYLTISTVPKKTEVPVTSSSRSSDLASKFLNFLDIPQTNAEIVSPLDVHVHHEVSRTQAPTLLTIPVLVIPESSPVFTNIPQSSHTFTHTPIQATPTPPPTIETINPLSTLPNFALVFRFNDRITTLEKEVAEIKKDPLHTQVTYLVDEHLDTRLGETREEFMNFLSESLPARIKEQVKDRLPQILPKEVSNFAPPVIEKLIKESRDEVTLAKVSSQPKSTYEAASTLTEFELKKILLDKMKTNLFYSYDVYSLKCGRKDKDKDEDPSAGSDRGLKKRKTSKDVEPTTGPKKKDYTSGSSKGTKSQPKSTGKSGQSEEPVFEVADSDMPQDQAGNLGDNEDEPRDETACRCDWFKRPTPPHEPTNLDWNVGKTPKEGPTQTWLMNLAASNPTDKSLKDFDELMSTLIDFSSFVLNGLKIENLTQEILLQLAFRLLKGTQSNYAELEYDFEELPFEFLINNDLKYLQGGILTMTYTMSTTKTKAAKYDLPGIEDMVPNIRSPVKVAYDKGYVYSTKRILAVTHVSVMRKHGYGYLEEIVVRRANNVLYRFKEGDFSRLWINDIEDMLILVVRNWLINLLGDDFADFAIALRMFIRSLVIQKRVKDLQLRVYDIRRNRLMRTDELYKFSDGTLTRLLSSLEDITKNINMTYLPKRRWSNLEKKRAHFMIKDINKLLKERSMMRSLEKFVGGRLYGTDLRLLKRTI
ncbi:hypothetical protein Tco_0880273, partial [Tanacetum coccineum]